MANNLMNFLALTSGYCCTYGFIRSFDRESSTSVAHRIGIATKTVNAWRERVRQGQCICLELCANPPTPVRNPDAALAAADDFASKSQDPAPEDDGSSDAV